MPCANWPPTTGPYSTAAPLSPFEPRLVELARSLVRPGERLPLVIGTAQHGPFRRSVAVWVGTGQPMHLQTFTELETHLRSWDGTYPNADQWLRAEQAAKDKAAQMIEQLERQASHRQREALSRQIAAARLRLLRELGRFLAALDAGMGDPNALLHQQMRRDVATAQRLRRCLDRLEGHPEWPTDLCRELESFAKQLTDNQRKARLIGKELDAALDDPRWLAVRT